jgi:predicted Zn-dependent protease
MGKPFVLLMEKRDEKVYQVIREAFQFLEDLAQVRIPVYPADESRNEKLRTLIADSLNAGRRQVDYDKLWKLAFSEFGQGSERPLIILDSDLYSAETRWEYGSTRAHHDIVLSVYRMKSYGPDWGLAFKTILLHELGHFCGLPDSTSPSYITEEKAANPLDAGHCNDRNCVMEQVDVDVDKGLTLPLPVKAKWLQTHNQDFFCQYDKKKIIEVLKKHYD